MLLHPSATVVAGRTVLARLGNREQRRDLVAALHLHAPSTRSRPGRPPAGHRIRDLGGGAIELEPRSARSAPYTLGALAIVLHALFGASVVRLLFHPSALPGVAALWLLAVGFTVAALVTFARRPVLVLRGGTLSLRGRVLQGPLHVEYPADPETVFTALLAGPEAIAFGDELAMHELAALLEERTRDPAPPPQ